MTLFTKTLTARVRRRAALFVVPTAAAALRSAPAALPRAVRLAPRARQQPRAVRASARPPVRRFQTAVAWPLTHAALLRAQAAQKMLIELSDTDETAALWFNNWIADARNKPIAGDAFIAELLAARPSFVKDSSCAAGPLPPPLHEVSPPELARRLLATRKAMAARIAKRNLGTHVEGANMQVCERHTCACGTHALTHMAQVLRGHLMRSTYVSGK